MFKVNWSNARHRGEPALLFRPVQHVPARVWYDVIDAVFATRPDELLAEGEEDDDAPAGGDVSTSSTQAFFIRLRATENPDDVVSRIESSRPDVSFVFTDERWGPEPDSGSISVKWSVSDPLELEQEVRFSTDVVSEPSIDKSEAHEILMVAGRRMWGDRLVRRPGWVD